MMADGREIIQIVQPILSTGSNEALKSATLNGLGIVYSLRPVFGHMVARGEVQEILKPYTKKAGLDLLALIPDQKQLPLRIKRFLDLLRDGSWRRQTTT